MASGIPALHESGRSARNLEACSCSDLLVQSARWIAVGVFGIMIEFVIFGIAHLLHAANEMGLEGERHFDVCPEVTVRPSIVYHNRD